MIGLTWPSEPNVGLYIILYLGSFHPIYSRFCDNVLDILDKSINVCQGFTAALSILETAHTRCVLCGTRIWGPQPLLAFLIISILPMLDERRDNITHGSQLLQLSTSSLAFSRPTKRPNPQVSLLCDSHPHRDAIVCQLGILSWHFTSACLRAK